MVALAFIALVVVLLSELLDWTGHGGVIDRYIPKARLLHVARPIRLVLLCGSFVLFMSAEYAGFLGDAARLLTGRPITLSAPTTPAPLASRSATPSAGPATGTPSSQKSGTTLILTGEEHAAPAPKENGRADPTDKDKDKDKVGEENGGNDETAAAQPRVPAVAPFTCDGFSEAAGDSAAQKETAVFDEMVRLNNAHQYTELIRVCSAAIQSNPSWPTPYLFCGLGYLGSSDLSGANDMLRRFQTATRGTSGLKGACKQASDFLAGRLTGQ